MRQFRLFFLLTLLSACALALLTPGVGAWQITLRDFPRSSARAQAVVIDAAGDVISTGHFPSFSVVKMSGATGEVRWRYSSLLSATPTDIAVDANGDVFIVSTTRAVLKLSGVDGTQIWSKPVGGTSNAFQNYIYAVKVDGNGDVVTAGSVGGHFNVSKLDGRTGEQMWHYEREGFIEYAKSVAIDPSGNVAAAGLSNKNFAVVKLQGSNGLEIWERELNGVGTWTDVFEEANAVVMDSDGSVIAAGNTSNIYAHTRDFTVVKYAPDGDLLWSHAIDGKWCVVNDRNERVCQSNDEANAVTLGRDGSVFVAGSMQTNADAEVPGANEHFFVAKFSRDGDPIWGEAAEDRPRRGEYTRGRAVTISVDSSGDVVAAGQHGERFTVVKFRGGGSSAVARAWVKQPGLPPTPGNHSTALEVVSDADNVVVAGETMAEDQFTLYTVIKLRGADGSDYVDEPRPDVPETVRKYAPLVYLHPDDKYRPDDPSAFIRKSGLGWYHGGGCPPDVIAERYSVQGNRLGNGNASGTRYSHKPMLPRASEDESCTHSNRDFKADAYTRPWDGSERNVPGNGEFWGTPFYEMEGFYIDLDDTDHARQGIPSTPGNPLYPGAPVFYEYVQGRYVTYWFFYPYNAFSIKVLRPGLPVPSIEEVEVQKHEGDWERISVQLDENDLPVNVFYYSHDGGNLAHWSTLDKFEGTHPIVYSAKGSHGSFPDEGVHLTSTCFPVLGCAPDHTARGPQWLTWNNLQNVQSQPWYGFGGAWGQVSSNVEVPFLGTILPGKEFTGPLGPSEYKNSRGKWFLTIGGRVTEIDGRGLGSAKLTLANAQGDVVATAVTDENGRYVFADLTFGHSYTITPSKQGSVFSPLFRSFPGLRDNQTANFIALDLIPPALSLPADIIVDAYVPQGATVYYDVTATDNITPNPRVDCVPPSGAIFNVGSTTVTCTTSDEDGNTTSGSFTVTVKGADRQMTDLLSVIRQLGLKKADENKLTNELEQALKASALGQPDKACRNLDQFKKKVQQERGKGLTAQQATQLITSATRISTVIGCH